MNRIFFMLPDLSAGGAERVTITIARLLHKEGYDVEFVNFGYHRGEMLDWIEPEFKMTSFNCSRVLGAIPVLTKFMKTQPNSVYFASREHVNIIGLLCARIAGCKIVVRIPNMPRNTLTKGFSGLKMRIIKCINRWLLPSAKMVIAQNEEMKQQLLDYYSLSTDKVIAINNPVDKDYVIAAAEGSDNPYNQSETIFLNVCNIAYSKGIDILIDAWDKVKSSIPNAHMYVVGRNGSGYARQLMERVKGREDFTFLGFQSNPYPYIKHCNCFVLPSRMEGFPNVVLEAMCFNRPVACSTCVDVIKKIITEGKNGFYCDIDNADAIADCMIKASKLKNIDNNYDLFDLDKLLRVFK